MSRSETDWYEKIEEEDFIVVKDKGREHKTVPLAVLSRLADEAGLQQTECQVKHASNFNDGRSYIIFYCTARLTFDDHTVWSGSADCHRENTKVPFINYPSATAESRALARAMKRALKLHHVLATEEIEVDATVGQANINPSAKADRQLVRTITANIDRLGINGIDVIEAVCSAERRDEIFAIEELTNEEARKAIQYIDDLKSSKKITKKDRTERKKELEAKIGGK